MRHAYQTGLIRSKAKAVVDMISGIEFRSAKEAAAAFGIPYNTLRGYLNAQIKNPTSLKYKEAA